MTLPKLHLFTKWKKNPEPLQNELDPQVIYERPTTGSPCYLWHTQHESTEWLLFDGEPVAITQ